MSEIARINDANATRDGISPLIAFALRGLRSCWMPQARRWSHIYYLDGRPEPNESLPAFDVYYTLNVLLGLSQISPTHGLDLPEIFNTNVSLVHEVQCPAYAYGMALWVAAELGLAIPSATRDAIISFIDERKNWRDFNAQDLGLIIVGCVAQARLEGRSHSFAAVAKDLFAFLHSRYSHPSGLFFDASTGPRKNFSSFATHTYLSLASYVYGEWSGDSRAISLANACARKLIALQGPQGEWPWFYFTPGGHVVDCYEVYAVHQHGMAPAFLEFAEKHGVPGANAALIKGFNWIFGQNELQVSMLWKREGLICRSQVRKGELASKKKRVARAISNALTGGRGTLVGPTGVELRLECRSYELGWILWSLGRRTDMSQLLYHPEFS
jgi:hypothetical protein